MATFDPKMASSGTGADYAKQNRSESSYARYLRGMDASMRQKVALTAAHLLGVGRVADMGMGSGTGSAALARLYPELEVVGVDVSENLVARARKEFAAVSNLSFVEGDIAQPQFEPGSLGAVFNSSVLHHVTTFTGYDHSAAQRALAVHVNQLAVGGFLIVRDFVAPEVSPGNAPYVILDLPADDGQGEDPSTCSTAALFERFATEFRSLHAEPGFTYRRAEEVLPPNVPAPAPGRVRFGVDLRQATEFLLRKDYRSDWYSEVKEEYTYFTQRQFETVFRDLGLRVLASFPIWNPWIVQNRFRGRFELYAPTGERLEDPPTNYLIVGEKVRAQAAVSFTVAPGAESTPPARTYLKLRHYEETATGKRFTLARRPNQTLDLFVWFETERASPEDERRIMVLVRKSYPRPIASLAESLDGATPSGWVTEPLVTLLRDEPMGETVERALLELARIAPDQILRMERGERYFPSPGGIEEEVRSVFVEIKPLMLQRDLPPSSGFSSSGHVAALDATQLLRAAHVGSLPDARLELGIYRLLDRLGRSPGPFIGSEELGDTASAGTSPATEDSALLPPVPKEAPRRAFRALGTRAHTEQSESAATSPAFIAIKRRVFEERTASGEVLTRQPLEYVIPQTRARTSVTAALLRPPAPGSKTLELGVSQEDLPAAQAFNGHSNLRVAPAWRLPRSSEPHRTASALAFLEARLLEEHAIALESHSGNAVRHGGLGGSYFPSAGLTPEWVYPFWLLLPPSPASEPTPGLEFVPLERLVSELPELEDAHLRLLVLRSAHAVGLLA